MNAQGRSFLDILEDELRKEIRAELMDELGLANGRPEAPPLPSPTATAHERLELWLAARVSPRPRPKTGAYQRPTTTYRKEEPKTEASPAARAPSPTRHQHDLDVMDIAALEFFRRQGEPLEEDFTAEELRSAYRKLALKTHPDRHAQKSEHERARYTTLFMELTAQSERLARHFNPSRAASAA